MLTSLIVTYALLGVFLLCCAGVYFHKNKEPLGFWQTGILLVLCAFWPLCLLMWFSRRDSVLQLKETNLSKILHYMVGVKINMGNYVDHWRVIRLDANGNLKQIRINYVSNELDVHTRVGDAFFFSGRDESRNLVYFFYPILVDGEMPDLLNARKLENHLFEEKVACLVNPILLEMFNFKSDPPRL